MVANVAGEPERGKTLACQVGADLAALAGLRAEDRRSRSG